MSYSQLVEHINKPRQVAIKPIQSKIVDINKTIHQKKQSLIVCLHALLTCSFPRTISKKDLLNIRIRVSLIRVILHKLKSANHYLEEVALHELGIVKKPVLLEALKSKRPFSYLDKRHKALTKQERVKLEATVYRLMHDIIRFDSRLIGSYGRELSAVDTRESYDMKDLQSILQKQSEYLDHLEAKIPPAKKVSLRVFSQKAMQDWLPLVFALLHHLEIEHEKERHIFAKLKKGKAFRSVLERKIKHILEEKQRVLDLQQKRALAMERFGQPELKKAFHQYLAAAHL